MAELNLTFCTTPIVSQTPMHLNPCYPRDTPHQANNKNVI